VTPTRSASRFETLPEAELTVHYRPFGSIVRGPMSEALDETADVEKHMSDAMDGIPGAAIIDKSGWEWQLRIP
jgi:hypothetical protein